MSERAQKVLQAVPEVCAETGVRRGDVKVKAIAGPRVTIGLPASTPKSDQQKYLTMLELQLRAKVDSRIEVFLDDKKDTNAKRHSTEEVLGLR